MTHGHKQFMNLSLEEQSSASDTRRVTTVLNLSVLGHCSDSSIWHVETKNMLVCDNILKQDIKILASYSLRLCGPFKLNANVGMLIYPK